MSVGKNILTKWQVADETRISIPILISSSQIVIVQIK